MRKRYVYYIQFNDTWGDGDKYKYTMLGHWLPNPHPSLLEFRLTLVY